MSKKGIRRWLKYVFLGIIGFLAVILLWGLIEPYVLDSEQETAVIPDLPAAWNGQQVAQVSDFQVGMWMDNLSTVRRSVEELIEVSPAIALLSGDFIYHSLQNPDPEINKVIDLLRPLTDAGIPTYAVLGNHDYSHKPPVPELADQVASALESIGIVVLRNESVPLPPPQIEPAATDSEANSSNTNTAAGQTLYLVGVDSHIAQRDRVQAALAEVPANSPRIVMMHNPATFPQFPANTAPLAIAGHTHGGQIRLPFTPTWSWLNLTEKGEVHADGWIEDSYGQSGNQLYVNRGIGFSTIPIRIHCTPEVTFFTLTASEEAAP